MKFFRIIIFFVFIISTAAQAGSFSDPEIKLSSAAISRGDVLLIIIKSENSEKPVVTWIEKNIPLVYNVQKKSWSGFLAADLSMKTGKKQAAVELPGSGYKKIIDIEVMDKDYGVRKLTLPKDKVDLDAASLERVKKENAVINAIWDSDETIPLWSSNFVMPADGEVGGTFGKRSVINNQERSPHTGVDQKGGTGDPVRAVNDGKIILIANHFFTGNSIYMDHGGGIISMYFHLNKVIVKEGETVKKGQKIAEIGSTGRVTGPHLHWGVRINGARVNPLTLVSESRNLEE